MTAIQFSHATGFPAESYRYFFQQLSPYEVTYVPVFGEGRFRLRNSWRNLVPELIEDIEIKHKEPVIGIGHSFGAVLTFWAAMQRPDLFQKVILIDPPFINLRFRIFSAFARLMGQAEKMIPIARNAKRRRDTFKDFSEASAYWRPKRLFRNFHPECFEDYVKASLVPDGSEMTLRISADEEAKMFASTPVFIGSGKFKIPSYYLYPAKGSVLMGNALAEQKKRFSNTEFMEIEKGGHMFPLEYPLETAEILKKLISTP